MKRKESEENQNVESSVVAVLPILVIGAILGTILGCIIELDTTSIFMRIVFCICAGVFGSIIALLFTYIVCEAIEDIQNMIKTRKEKDFID